MNKRKWLLYGGFALLSVLLYFGTSVKSKSQKTLEKSRVLVKQIKSTQVLLKEAYHSLSGVQKAQVDEIQVMLEQSADEENNLNLYERLAGLWYAWGYFDVSGHYAEKIAEERNTPEAWSIAGTTYSRGIQADVDDRSKRYSANKARAAFEQSQLLQPDNPEVALNLALTYVQLPEQTNPMQGIQMLLNLKEAQPKYGPVYRHLGMLAIQTGQYEKAVERLRQASVLEPSRKEINCLLADAFIGLNQSDSSAYYKTLCNN